MEIYQLTTKGESLATNIYAPNVPAWRVIQFLHRRGQATKEQLLNFVPSATWHTLNRLRRKEVIQLVGRSVEV